MKHFLLMGAAAVFVGCAMMPAKAQTSTAELAPTTGNTTKGTVTFVQQGDKVAVSARVTGLPQGAHGFHIHEKGDCSSGDGNSAGGHFNPTAKPHGDPASPDHHTGDMPMLQADASGNASIDVVLAGMTIGGGATDVLDKAVIVHKDADDYKTQPTGNSGARVACGVIRKS